MRNSSQRNGSRVHFLFVIVALLVSSCLLLSARSPQGVAPSALDGIAIRVTGPAEDNSSACAGSALINGYASSIDGQTINYHSAHADAEAALIVRAQSIAHSISWKSDPLPSCGNPGFYHLIWLVGLEFSGWAQEKEPHTFHLSINGHRWFTFKNFKDATARKWSIAGDDGAELAFEATTADTFGDLFGYMHLIVPRKDFPVGAPLTFEVVSEDAGSPDWYMTFQYGFHFTPRVRVEPALVRDAGGEAQLLRLSLDNLTTGRTIQVRLRDRELVNAPLNVGANIFGLPIPAVKSPQPLAVYFAVNDAPAESFTVNVTPVPRREIYLTSYSHNDIGYTDLQPDVERKQWRNLEEGLQLTAQTRDFPLDARFKWNFETIWALESYLRQAPEEKRQAVLTAIRDGNLGVSALYANMLTGLANAPEMSHFFDFARRLHAEYGLTVDTAVSSDVPGYSWGIVSALAQNGVKYFAVGPNTGDRIGFTLEAWGDKPFYWVSQSGKEKVLMWVAAAGYSMFHEGQLSKLGGERILKLARQLEERNYPYDMVYLPYTLGDNGPPDPTLAEFVKQWNEHYVTPRLVLATQRQMFHEFEKRYGASLPRFSGDFTPYWEDGAASTAHELALARRAVNELIQGEALWSLRAPREYPRAEYDAAWRNIIFWDEHTWGAHNSVEEPDLPFVTEQWEFKRKFALDAANAAHTLLIRALGASAQTGAAGAAFDVYNTSSWPRTDLVLLPAAQTSVGDRVEDVDGHPAPSQRLSTGELAVFVEDVPPLGAKRLCVRSGAAFQRGSISASGNSLESTSIALHVNEQTGVIDSLRWKSTNTELVDRNAVAGLAEYLYVPGTNPASAQQLSNVRVSLKERGSLVGSLLVEGEAPGAKKYSTEIRLIEGLARVDLLTEIDKRAVREKEGVHIAFPFRVPGAQVRYDVADGIVRPETDQLAGACKNFYSVVSWADASNADFGVTLAVPDAPLIEMGTINAEKPWMRTNPPSPLLYSYVMNNYWHTNYKADQGGPVKFSYSIAPHAAFDPAVAARFGRERREPLLVASADASRSPMHSLFRVELATVLVSSLKPLGADSWLVRLYNPTPGDQRVRLQLDPSLRVSAKTSDAFGHANGNIPGAIPLAAYGSLYVLVNRAP